MVPFSQVVADLKLLYQPDSEGYYPINIVSDEQVSQWIAGIGIPRREFYDQIALRLAHGFHRGELEYGFCDSIVSDLYSVAVLTERIPELPEIFWETFNAFDQGEFYHDKDRQEDPVE